MASPATSVTSPASPAAANPAVPGNPAVAGKRAKVLVVGGDTFDFGAKEIGEEFQHVFVIQNVGDADLTLEPGKPSCQTCTSFNVDKKLVQPGDSARATVKWHVKTETPRFRQYAPFKTNDPDMPEIKLQSKCEVVNRIVLEPRERWDMGDVVVGSPKEFIATLTSGLVNQFQIVSVTNASPDLKVAATPMTADELSRLKVKSGYVLKAVLNSDIPVGEFKNKVTIKVRVPDEKQLTVDVTAHRSGPVQIFGPSWNEERTALGLGAFDPRQALIARLNLVTRGIEDELKFVKVTCPDDRFSVQLKPDARFKGQTGELRRYELFVKVAASKREAVYSTLSPLVMLIDTNQDQVSQFKLKITCQALP